MSSDDCSSAEGPPSALQKCLRCKGPTIAARALPLLFPSLLHLSSQCRRYFTFDTETKAPSAPCRFHPGHFRPYGGVTGGTLAYGGMLPYWRCCGATRRDAPGCKVLSHHAQDERFMDITLEYSLADRNAAPVDWPPPTVCSAQLGGDGGERNEEPKGKCELPKDWVEVRVTREDTVSKLAIRYGCDTVLFRAINRLPSDMLLMSRATVLVPPHDPEAKPPPPPMTEAEIRDQMVRRLMKLGPMTMEEGRCYLDMAGGSVERALWEFKADKAWEKDHPPPISAKGKPLAIRGMST